ncbi:hypothetical protein FB451DRAFT_1441840 [Mycena latifolia]|nr:hypothetical protein FB451DRAFT_1441840 [Mycena latifolia]
MQKTLSRGAKSTNNFYWVNVTSRIATDPAPMTLHKISEQHIEHLHALGHLGPRFVVLVTNFWAVQFRFTSGSEPHHSNTSSVKAPSNFLEDFRKLWLCSVEVHPNFGYSRFEKKTKNWLRGVRSLLGGVEPVGILPSRHIADTLCTRVPTWLLGHCHGNTLHGCDAGMEMHSNVAKHVSAGLKHYTLHCSTFLFMIVYYIVL